MPAKGERNDRPWFQVQAATLDSIDLNRLSAEHERVFWRLHALCCRQGHGDTIHATATGIAWALRLPEQCVKEALSQLSEPGSDGEGMIEWTDTYVRIVKWDQYQPRTTSSERSRDARRSGRQAATGKRQDRDGDATTHATGVRRRTQRDCVSLEAEAEGEEEEDHTQPPAVRAGQSKNEANPSVAVGKGGQGGSMPPGLIRRRPVAKSDDELKPLFEAYCAGAQQSLTWQARYMMATEQLFAHGRPAARIRAVAAFYRRKLKDGVPNYLKFAAEIDKWDAECPSARTAGASAKTPEQWRAEGRCPQHPGEKLNSAGDCDLCVGLREFEQGRGQETA